MDEFLILVENALRLFEIEESGKSVFVVAGLMFARMLSFLMIVPFFGGSVVPARVKIAMAMMFVVVLYPSLQAGLPGSGLSELGVVALTALLAKEAFVGFSLGFVASLVFEAIAVAGCVMDLQRGSMMAESFAPQLQARVSELGQFKLQFSIVLFLATGAHRAFIRALAHSFEILPVTVFPHIATGWTTLPTLITKLAGGVLANGVQLAAPVIVALLLTDFFFGLVNRAAPQINVFFLSMPVKMGVGIIVVICALPFFKDRCIVYFQDSLAAFEALIRAFGGVP